MKLVYIGPHDKVTVPLPGGGQATVERGKVLDTQDGHAKDLMKQHRNWKPEPVPQKAMKKQPSILSAKEAD